MGVVALLGLAFCIREAVAQNRVSSGFQSRDLAIDGANRLLVVNDRDRVVQAVVIVASADDMRRSGSVVLTRVAIDALPFVAPMIDALGTPGALERLVRERRPTMARLFDPRRSMKGAALRSAPSFGVFGIGAPEPRVARSLDAVVLTLREHQVRMGIMFEAVSVAAIMEGQRVRELFVGRELLREFTLAQLAEEYLAQAAAIGRSAS